MKEGKMEINPNNFESEENKKKNPNSIGELLSVGKDLPTLPNKVYRSVNNKEAIDDLNESGVVRNKQSAGIVERSRWGERVFWSKGVEGKFHVVSNSGYVIEAPLLVAQERVVKKEDVTAIYTKNENGEVVNILDFQNKQENEKTNDLRVNQEAKDAENLRKIRENIENMKN